MSKGCCSHFHSNEDKDDNKDRANPNTSNFFTVSDVG